jgi:TatD DNase family protein
MIDFHTHLDLYPDPTDVVRRCVEAGMHVLSVTTTPSAYAGTLALASNAPRIRTALGLHPQIAGERYTELPLFEALLPDARYIGEVGLDGSPEFASTWTRQIEVFDTILALCARSGGRVFSVHSRRAVGQVLDAIEEHPSAGTPVFHWFAGTRRDLERASSLGCWFSVGPAMVNGTKGRALVEGMPRERVLTESDGPFARMAGRAVLPWDVAATFPVLAQLWNADEIGVDRQLKDNLRALGALAGQA